MPFNKVDWRNYRVGLCITANHGTLPVGFLWNLLNLQKPNEYVTIHQGKHIKSDSLNRQVEQAFEERCDKVLFMDIDMEFPVDTIPRLLSHNLPIVSGLYHSKAYPFPPVVGWNRVIDDGGLPQRVNGMGWHWKKIYHPMPRNQLVEVDWCGIGCLMVDIDVFRKGFDAPVFKDDWDDQQGNRQRGHDIRFCDIMKERGYKIYCDTSVSCGHVGKIVIDRLYIESFYKAQMDKVQYELYKKHSDGRVSQQNVLDNIEEANRVRPDSPAYWDAKHWKWIKNEDSWTVLNDVYNLMAPMIPNDVSVLDLGCGTSNLLYRLKDEKNCDVYGYDHSSEAVKFQKEHGVSAEIADLRDLDLKKMKKYHTVLLSHILEHLKEEDVNKVLDAIKHIAIHQAIIVVPQEIDLETLWYSKLEHKRIYDEVSLGVLLKPYFHEVRIAKIKPKGEETQAWINRHILAQCLVEPKKETKKTSKKKK